MQKIGEIIFIKMKKELRKNSLRTFRDAPKGPKCPQARNVRKCFFLFEPIKIAIDYALLMR